MWFCEVIRCFALYFFLCHCVNGEISDELKSAIDGFSAAFDELYPQKQDKTTEAAILPEKVEKDEAVGSVQQVSEPPIHKEVAIEKGGTIVMNITPEAKVFARDSLSLVDSSLVLRDVKNFTAEVINGIKRTLIVEIENGNQDIKTCSIELFEPPGKNTSKVTWSDCSVLPSISTGSDSELVAPSISSNSDAEPSSIAVDNELVSPSTVDVSEPVMLSVTAGLEETTPCASVELVSSPPITSEVDVAEQQSVDSHTTVSENSGADTDEVDVAEQQSVDSYTTVSENSGADTDDTIGKHKRETEKTRGFNDIGIKIAEELGKFALSTLDAIDADSNKRVVEKIQSAKKEIHRGLMQVAGRRRFQSAYGRKCTQSVNTELVDGIPLYEIVMQVRETQCPERSSEDCKFSNTDPQQLCSVTLQSSLNNKSPAYARVVKSECNIIDPVTVGIQSCSTLITSSNKQCQALTKRLFLNLKE